MVIYSKIMVDNVECRGADLTVEIDGNKTSDNVEYRGVDISVEVGKDKIGDNVEVGEQA